MGRLTALVLVASGTVAGLVLLAALWSRERRQRTEHASPTRSGKRSSPPRVHYETSSSSNDCDSGSFVQVDYSEVEGDPAPSTEGRRAPPPTRNTSNLEMVIQEGRAAMGASDDDDDDGDNVTKTPPPSRNASSTCLNEVDVNEVEFPASGSTFLELPGGAASHPASSGSSHGSEPAVLSNEFAAAVSLSLGMQGFEILDEPGEAGEDPLGSSAGTDFSLLSSGNAGDTGSWSLASSLNMSGDPMATRAPPSSDAIRDTLETMERSAADMTTQHAEVLTSLLGSQDQGLQEQVLVYVGNAAAFTKNQDAFRDVGCLSRLATLLKAHAMALHVSHSVAYPTLVNKAITAVNNLAANESNQKQLQESLPALFSFATSSGSPESVQLGSLQALTNLSTSNAYQAPYTQIIQQLYELVDSSSQPLRKQAIKVLVNLSTNPDMVPHLLAAKAPSSLLTLLAPDVEESTLLAWTAFLGNVMTVAHNQQLTAASLPTQHKAASPETMYTAIYGVANAAKLRSKVFVLSKHAHTDVQNYASRIYGSLA